MTNTAVVLTSAVRSAYDQVTVVCTDASANTYTATFPLTDSPLGKPSAPVLATATSGGTVLAGVYTVEVSYVGANGEDLPSAAQTITTTGSVSTLTITSPVASGGATGWYAYVSQANGSTLTRQQTAGTPTAIGSNLTITAPPTSSGAAPLTIANDSAVTNLFRALTA